MCPSKVREPFACRPLILLRVPQIPPSRHDRRLESALSGDVSLEALDASAVERRSPLRILPTGSSARSPFESLIISVSPSSAPTMQPAAGRAAKTGDLPAVVVAIAGENGPEGAACRRVSENQPIVRPVGPSHEDFGDFVAGHSPYAGTHRHDRSRKHALGYPDHIS